jgi:hypothetical protein
MKHARADYDRIQDPADMTLEATLLLQPKNTMPKIESIWAFVSLDPRDGNEGVCAAMIGGAMMPLIAADRARLASLRPIAMAIAKTAALTGTTIKLVQFTRRIETEVIEP